LEEEKVLLRQNKELLQSSLYFTLRHPPTMGVWNPPKKNISETHTNYEEWQKLQSPSN